MGRNIWIWLFVIIGIGLSTVSGPASGAQLAINSTDSMLWGRPIANQGNGESTTWETQKVGMEIAPNFRDILQWSDISNNIVYYPSVFSGREVFHPYGTIWMYNWAAEDIFSSHNLISSKETQAEEEDDASGLPSLPNALWVCGFGIIGILSVRRTNNHSNGA